MRLRFPEYNLGGVVDKTSGVPARGEDGGLGRPLACPPGESRCVVRPGVNESGRGAPGALHRVVWVRE